MQDPTKLPRRLLACVLFLGLLGVGAELVLVEHWDDWKQLIPLVTLGVGLLALVWDGIAGSRASRWILRFAMLGLIAAAVAGIYLHYQSNVEFQLELEPDLSGWPLVLETLRASSPPTLAPGSLALLGAIGWITTLGRPPADASRPGPNS